MYPTSPLLEFAENTLQIAALLAMATVYALKIRWIFGFPAGGDRQAPGRNPSTNAPRGTRYSLGAIAMPWTMPSTRQHRILYAQFVVFHLGVAASILMSFLIPYAPGLMRVPVVIFAFQVLFAAAAAAGVIRLGRRVANPYMRAISSPDDYFSLALLIVWLLASFAAAPNQAAAPLLIYFFLTAFFLVYVPFSKISHYIYYPLARWYLGKTLGHRGVFPLVKGV
jgi:nitrate reductase gamma subunit